eukprot:gene10134-biopygen2928
MFYFNSYCWEARPDPKSGHPYSGLSQGTGSRAGSAPVSWQGRDPSESVGSSTHPTNPSLPRTDPGLERPNGRRNARWHEGVRYNPAPHDPRPRAVPRYAGWWGAPPFRFTLLYGLLSQMGCSLCRRRAPVVAGGRLLPYGLLRHGVEVAQQAITEDWRRRHRHWSRDPRKSMLPHRPLSALAVST